MCKQSHAIGIWWILWMLCARRLRHQLNYSEYVHFSTFLCLSRFWASVLGQTDCGHNPRARKVRQRRRSPMGPSHRQWLRVFCQLCEQNYWGKPIEMFADELTTVGSSSIRSNSVHLTRWFLSLAVIASDQYKFKSFFCLPFTDAGTVCTRHLQSNSGPIGSSRRENCRLSINALIRFERNCLSFDTFLICLH